MAAADKNSATGEEELKKNKGAQDTNKDDYDNAEKYSDIKEEEEEEEEESSSEEENEEPQRKGFLGKGRSQALQRGAKERLEGEDENEGFNDAYLYDFPKDPENWTEEDLQEIWADAPTELTNDIGWDPDTINAEDWELIQTLREEGEKVTTEPFYVPYRKYYPPVYENHFDINNPRSVVEELERLEEFIKWASFVFEDGSTYEGTVWDDLAQGKGVYTTPMELCRFAEVATLNTSEKVQFRLAVMSLSLFLCS